VYPLTAADIQARYKHVTERVKKSIDAICNLRPQDYSKDSVLYGFDKAVSYMSSFAGAIELVHMVSPDEIVRESGAKYVQELQHFGVEIISSNKALYKVFKEYASTVAHGEQLTKEEAYFLKELLADFKRGGLELPDEELQKVTEIRKQLASLTTQFEVNISQDVSVVKVKEEELAGVSAEFISALKRAEDGLCELKLDYPTQDMIMRECAVAQTRKKYYEAISQKAYPLNVSVLSDIIALRDALAKALGFASYAHLDLEDQMISSPEKARSLQMDLLPALHKKVEKEFEVVLKDLPEGVVIAPGKKINPWDLAYLQNYYKKKYYSVDESLLAEYFPLEGTLEKLFAIYQQFFSLTFTTVPCLSTWHPDVQLIQVNKNDGGVVGYVFLDLFPRDNKYGHAAQFGCIAAHISEGGVYYPGVVTLVCNFTKSTSDKPSLLRYSEVNTFFHEFGHALHSLLGGTRLSSQAGTSVKRDFVETPSQMLENWLDDKAILKGLGRHYKTGLQIDDVLLDKKLESLKIFMGFSEARQLFLGMFSLDLYLSGGTKDIEGIMKSYYQKMTPNIIFSDANKMYCSFGHLTGYGAKYYGYLWARILGADIFEQIKQEGLLSPSAGARYAQSILVPGGSRDPYEMVTEYLGREPRQDAFLKKNGL